MAGLCVAFGMNTFGAPVIATVGKGLASIDFHRGWCVEFASTATVVIATLMECEP